MMYRACLHFVGVHLDETRDSDFLPGPCVCESVPSTDRALVHPQVSQLTKP